MSIIKEALARSREIGREEERDRARERERKREREREGGRHIRYRKTQHLPRSYFE